MLAIGDTFLLPKKADSKEHLWIVITEERDGLAVGVNLTKVRDGCDMTVVVNPGDHPFVNCQSIALYQDSRMLNLKSLEELFKRQTQNFTCSTHAKCSDIFLKRLQGGLIGSPFTPNEILEFCAKEWGVQLP